MLVLIAAAVAAVSSPSPSPSASPIPQIAHVVTSDRSDEAITRATRVTYVVTQQQIQRYGYRTIGDAIAAVPAVEMESYGAIGANQSYGIRGSETAQVLVLVNGMPAPGSLSNTVNLGAFSTAGVERIEIVEGGGSTLYGQGSIGGIINIITNRQPATAGTLRYGSFDDRELRAAAYGFTFERIDSTNAYSLPSYTLFGTPLATTRENADYEATTLRYGGAHAFGTVDAELNLGIDSTHGGAPGFYPFVSTTSRQDEVDKDGTLTLRTHGKRSTTTLQLNGTAQQIAFDCNETVEPSACFQPSQSLSLESRVAADLRNTVDAGHQQIVYGIDLSRGTVQTNTGGATVPVAPSATPPPPVSSAALAQTAAYVEDVADVTSTLRAYGGLRAERDGSLGGEISPSLGVEAAFSKTASLKLNYATAFRAPNASELYYPGYGNPNLHPERAQVGDVTFTDTSVLGGLSVGWFTNHTNDLIVPVLVQSYPQEYIYIYQPENIDHALMQGLTFDLKTRPYNGLSFALNATDLYTALNLSTHSRLPNDAVFTVNAGLQIAAAPSGAFGGAGISARIVGARGPIDQTQPLFFQPVAYTNLGAYVALRLAPHMSLYLRGYNLGSERYADVLGYPLPGRAFALELQANP
jgi:vitamin B12 transporter